MDLDGKPIGKASDIPMAGKLGGVMGVGVAANGDVWIADGTKNHMLFFPGGRVKRRPDRRGPGAEVAFRRRHRCPEPCLGQQRPVGHGRAVPRRRSLQGGIFRAGISVRGVALDSKGNLWVASNMSLDFPPPVIPDGVSIMKQFQIAARTHAQGAGTPHPKMTTGVVNMIRPDGSQPAPKGFTGGKVLNVPWGVSIDGNDDVWVGNFWGRGVVLMAGDGTKGHPAGTKTGDVIHQFQSGSIQMITDVAVDPAGNVWAANNWDVIEP